MPTFTIPSSQSLLTWLVAFLGVCVGSARAAEALPESFKLHRFSDPTGAVPWTMPYRLHVPSGNGKYPLIIHLHGAGQRGNDGDHVDGAMRMFTSASTQERFPAIVLAPQCPRTFDLLAIDNKDIIVTPSGVRYDRTKGDWQQLEIPLGKFVSGEKSHVVIAAAKDKKTDALAFDVRNLVIHNGDRATGLTVDLTGEPLSYLAGADPFDRTINADGSVRFVGTRYRYAQRLPATYDVKPETVLSVEVRLETKSRFVAFGMDNDTEPNGFKWVNADWEDNKPHTFASEPTDPMRMLIALIEQTIKDQPVDPTRIYVTGQSMGGFGAFDLAMRRPDLVAAVVGVCGGAADAEVDRVKNIPMRIFHGGKDPIVPTARSRSFVAALKAAGAEPIYTEYPGVGHDSWSKAFAEPDLLNWLFSQHRKPK